jgi:hypothetical protein
VLDSVVTGIALPQHLRLGDGGSNDDGCDDDDCFYFLLCCYYYDYAYDYDYGDGPDDDDDDGDDDDDDDDDEYYCDTTTLRHYVYDYYPMVLELFWGGGATSS